MILFDDGPVSATLTLVIVALSLLGIALGVRTAVTRRFPPVWVRFARPDRTALTQPVRIGGSRALFGGALLMQQMPHVVRMPFPVATAFLLAALAVLVTGMGWLWLRKD
jgi:hypothetical protein